LPTFRFDKAFGIARDIRARVEFKQIRSEIESKRQESEQAKNKINEIRNELKSKRQEAKLISEEQRTAKDKAKRSEYRNRKKRVQREILQLEEELRNAKERWAGGVPAAWSAPRVAGETGTGALPDFVVIGGKKCGTTFLYHLLTQHPLVERAAGKEVHFFNRSFDEGIEWYRRCFPTPRWKDGRRSITGEATPEYLTHPLAPKRMAEVIPQARLIALLRNPVERAYSDYHHEARKGPDARTLEEAMNYASLDDARSRCLSRSIYVDHLLRWSEFFNDEQMLVLKSEDFFERPVNTLQVVLNFLDLPEWEPKVWELWYKRNKGKYKQEIDPATRQRLEGYFKPHNKRLYEYLGVDFGW
jgi:hypothetical protein